MKRFYPSIMQGFSLLEAIVALTLISTFGLAIFSWVSSMLVNVDKIESNAQRQTIMRNVTEYLSNTNIMERPSGETTLGPYQIHWSSELVEPIRNGLNKSSGNNEFKIGLYNVYVSVSTPNTNKIVSFNMRLTGYSGQEALPF